MSIFWVFVDQVVFACSSWIRLDLFFIRYFYGLQHFSNNNWFVYFYIVTWASDFLNYGQIEEFSLQVALLNDRVIQVVTVAAVNPLTLRLRFKAAFAERTLLLALEQGNQDLLASHTPVLHGNTRCGAVSYVRRDSIVTEAQAFSAVRSLRATFRKISLIRSH